METDGAAAAAERTEDTLAFAHCVLDLACEGRAAELAYIDQLGHRP